MDYLKIYKTNYTKHRVGNDYDGGYVILNGLNYDILISCGIADDTSFENAFLKIHGNIKCYAFDGNINSLPNNSDNKIIFNKKNISKTETTCTTNLKNLIENNDNIFLKMDIETWEYDWLQVITQNELKKIKQIVIEFHFPFTDSKHIFEHFSYYINISNRIECLKKLADTHYLIHLHGNNCCGTTSINNIKLPNVFECTYVRKDLCDYVSDNNISIPDPVLDKPNIINTPDIYLSGYPFTI